MQNQLSTTHEYLMSWARTITSMWWPTLAILGQKRVDTGQMGLVGIPLSHAEPAEHHTWIFNELGKKHHLNAMTNRGISGTGVGTVKVWRVSLTCLQHFVANLIWILIDITYTNVFFLSCLLHALYLINSVVWLLTGTEYSCLHSLRHLRSDYLQVIGPVAIIPCKRI